MKQYIFSAKVTLWASRFVAALIAFFLIVFPGLVQGYHEKFRPMTDSERSALLGAFYASAPAVELAMYHMDRLLGNILRAELFTAENVRHIRMVRWCCLWASIVCLVTFFGFPALIFISIIMAFLALVVTVVGQVMKAAVELREESDLTI
ncbi:MAG: DUF2975 domain-containing protein [Oscillospiraceae bacterium]|nr:DUF2975 domain-containing protein [Oscillospiraceae bacterium]